MDEWAPRSNNQRKKTPSNWSRSEIDWTFLGMESGYHEKLAIPLPSSLKKIMPREFAPSQLHPVTLVATKLQRNSDSHLYSTLPGAFEFRRDLNEVDLNEFALDTSQNTIMRESGSSNLAKQVGERGNIAQK